jgi:hypothetical protein
MFTVIAAVAVLAITYSTDRLSDKEAVQRAMVFDDDIVRQNVVFARRDLRLIAWMLAAMLVMLGIIAEDTSLTKGQRTCANYRICDGVI